MAEPTKIRETSPSNGVSPDVAALAAQVKELIQQNAELAAQVNVLNRTMSVERPMALPLKRAQDREEEYERLKSEYSKTCLQRTQEAADRLWAKDTKDRYRVKVPGHLELLIPARSPEEAEGRYNKISGITGIDADKPRHSIELVSNAA
jgi:hypothetical protein